MLSLLLYTCSEEQRNRFEPVRWLNKLMTPARGGGGGSEARKQKQEGEFQGETTGERGILGLNISDLKNLSYSVVIRVLFPRGEDCVRLVWWLLMVSQNNSTHD